MMYILCLLYGLLYNSFATAQHYGFVYPNATNPTQQNLVLEVGEEIDIRWSSPFTSIKLAIVSEDRALFHVFSQNNTGTDISWPVSVSNSGSSDSYHYLYFENENDRTQHYCSARFRIHDPDSTDDYSQITPAVVTGSPGLVLQARATTTSSAGPYNTTGGITGAANITTAAFVFVGLSEGAKIGIGVGCPLGVLVFAGLVFSLFWRKERRARATRGEEEPPGILNLAGGDYSPENIPVPSFLGGDGPEPVADEKLTAQAEQQRAARKEKAKIPKRGAGRNPNNGYVSIEQRLEMSGIKPPPKPNKGKEPERDTGTSRPGNQRSEIMRE